MKKNKQIPKTEWDTLIKASIILESTLNDKLNQVKKDKIYYQEMINKQLKKNEL